ncbi:MAG: NAD(P)H-hydrate epimerase [Nitrososphaeraceae archaeon]|nr:NAD(P)H-hydrate epimerase [Nitrososphaeraceae archaeon]
MIIQVKNLNKYDIDIRQRFEEFSISSEQMYKIEDIGHNIFGMKKVLMMENAGYGIVEFILKKFKNIENLKITAICGTGNNGGDAMVAARHLSIYCKNQINVILLGKVNRIKTEEASMNFETINKMKKSIKLEIFEDLNSKIKNNIIKSDIIIDGVFGTGIQGDIKYPHSIAIDLINKSQAYTIAVDIPSGLNPNTGEINSNCVRADSTITFHRVKNGLLNNKKYTGVIYLKKIGLPKEVEDDIF